MSLHVGTMGWSYNHWVGNFYPQGTKAEEFLSFYSKHFNAVEVDSTFYRTPSKTTVERWKEQTPPCFKFSAKFPRAITHERMLASCEDRVDFFLKTMSSLDNKLGPLLVQLPPQFKPDRTEMLLDFLNLLPKDKRFVVEVRDKKWFTDSLYSLLSQAGVALAIVDHPWIPKTLKTTANFVYIRWEGDRRKIMGNTGHTERDRRSDIQSWAQEIRNFLNNGFDVYGYFSKFYSGHPPTDAKQLLGLVQDYTTSLR